MLLKTTCLTICITLLLTFNTQADLIVNGGFETGDFSNWSESGSVIILSETAILGGVSGGFGNFPKANGEFVVFFGAGETPATGQISQEFGTIVGLAYDLSFDYGRFHFESGGPQSVEVTITDALDNTDIFTTILTDVTGALDLSLLFDHYLFDFVATSNLTRITFRDVSAGTIGTDGVLDNVRITAVPEPNSLFLGMAGLMACVGSRRRNKSTILT